MDELLKNFSFLLFFHPQIWEIAPSRTYRRFERSVWHRMLVSKWFRSSRSSSYCFLRKMVPSTGHRLREGEQISKNSQNSNYLNRNNYIPFQALLYLIQLLDPIVKGDYVIAYFHTLTSTSNYPPLNWLKEVYSILPYKWVVFCSCCCHHHINQIHIF